MSSSLPKRSTVVTTASPSTIQRSSPRHSQSPSNSVAAAASTLLYQRNYGPGDGLTTASPPSTQRSELWFRKDRYSYQNNYKGNGGGDDGEDDNDDDIELDEDEEYDDNAPDSADDDDSSSSVIVVGGCKSIEVNAKLDLDGLYYSEDEAYLFNDIESEDDTRTSFPKDTNPKFIDGPQKPDVSSMSASEGAAVLKVWSKSRKAHTDKERLKRVKLVKSNNSSFKLLTGHLSETVRTMVVVEGNCLDEGHTFKNK